MLHLSNHFVDLSLVLPSFPSLLLGELETEQHTTGVAKLRGVVSSLDPLLFLFRQLSSLQGHSTDLLSIFYQDLQVLFCISAPQSVISLSSLSSCSVTNICGLGSSSWNWDNLILHTSVIFGYWFSPKTDLSRPMK